MYFTEPYQMKITKILLPLIISSALLASCTTSPEGRKQLKLLPDNQLDEMGIKNFTQLKEKTKISTDKNINRYVQCISNKIIPHVKQSPNPKDWEVVVFDDDQANAFALPGYKIGVYTGILKYAKNQDQLAAIIGHEVAHVIAKHSNERVSSQMATQTGLSILAAVLGENQTENADMIVAGLGLGVQYGITLPYSRSHETEADLIGLDLMAKAGFNPEESVPLWVNMSKQGKAPPEFMSTHPSSKTRIKELQKRIPKANVGYKSAVNQGRRAECKL